MIILTILLPNNQSIKLSKPLLTFPFFSFLSNIRDLFAARRRAHGHPHARLDGVAATHLLARAGAAAGEGPHRDHLRPGRLRLRRAAGRRQRVPAQGHAARGPLCTAVRVIAAGKALIAQPTVTRRLIEHFLPQQPAPAASSDGRGPPSPPSWTCSPSARRCCSRWPGGSPTPRSPRPSS